jgi:hypothetical protein
MTKQDKAPQKKRKNLRKNDLPVLDSTQDLFVAFMNPQVTTTEEKIKPSHREANGPRLNKHGLPVIDTFESEFLAGEPSVLSESQKNSEGSEDSDAPEENFELLLEASLKQTSGPPKKKPMPMPVKKRLKRYPPPRQSWIFTDLRPLGRNLRPKPLFQPVSIRGISPCA